MTSDIIIRIYQNIPLLHGKGMLFGVKKAV